METEEGKEEEQKILDLGMRISINYESVKLLGCFVRFRPRKIAFSTNFQSHMCSVTFICSSFQSD